MPFEFEGAAVRVLTQDGEPWFVAKDVAKVLGYADPDQAVRKHCKSLEKLNSVELTELGIANAPPSGLLIIPEPDLYRLILRSDKPEAERFERWVMAVVLPTIRKMGVYAPGLIGQLEAVQSLLGPLSVALADQALAIRGLQEEVAELRTIRDPRAATSDYRAAIDVVMALQALPKGRRTLAKRAGDGMARISALWQVPVKLCPVTRRRMFSAEVADYWVEKAGRQMVRDHNAAAVGQGVFSFEQERRRRHRDGAEDAGPPPASS